MDPRCRDAARLSPAQSHANPQRDDTAHLCQLGVTWILNAARLRQLGVTRILDVVMPQAFLQLGVA